MSTKKEMLNFPGLKLTFSALWFKNLAWYNHSSRTYEIPKGFAGNSDFVAANDVSKTAFDANEGAAACRYTVVTLSGSSLCITVGPCGEGSCFATLVAAAL